MILIGIGTVIWWGVKFVDSNDPARQKIDKFFKSSLWREGVKDIKTWTGELFKGVGEKLEGDVTEEERRQLDRIIVRELGKKKQEAGNKKQEVGGKGR